MLSRLHSNPGSIRSLARTLVSVRRRCPQSEPVRSLTSATRTLTQQHQSTTSSNSTPITVDRSKIPLPFEYFLKTPQNGTKREQTDTNESIKQFLDSIPPIEPMPPEQLEALVELQNRTGSKDVTRKVRQATIDGYAATRATTFGAHVLASRCLSFCLATLATCRSSFW